MIHSGSIAALAVAFGLYAGQILPLSTLERNALSVACILVFTTLNCLGIRAGKLVQNIIAVAKISGMAAIIFLLCVRGSHPIHLFPEGANIGGGGPPVIGFAATLIAVLWTYEGWHVISFVAGEMKRPRRDLPRSLFFSVPRSFCRCT
jgi:basic amino acid/polyamine antiporter, APA family